MTDEGTAAPSGLSEVRVCPADCLMATAVICVWVPLCQRYGQPPWCLGLACKSSAPGSSNGDGRCPGVCYPVNHWLSAAVTVVFLLRPFSCSVAGKTRGVQGHVAVQGLLRSKLEPEIFSHVNELHCKYLAEEGFTSAKGLAGITRDDLPSDFFSGVLRLQIPRAFSPSTGQSLLSPDSDIKSIFTCCSSLSESSHWVGNLSICPLVRVS